MRNIKNNLLLAVLSLAVGGLFFSVISTPAYAVAPAPKPLTCSGGGLKIPTCTGSGPYVCPTGVTGDACLKTNPITLWIVFAINLLSTVIVIGASTMLVFAGIEYITAADNPQKIQAAKDKIRNVIIGIVAFFFMFAFLQWLIPGGVL